MAFSCEVDMGGKKVPAVWSEALKILQKNYANFLVISAFADVMHYKIGISGIYTEKFILLCLISDQGRKILRDGMVGISLIEPLGFLV